MATLCSKYMKSQTQDGREKNLTEVGEEMKGDQVRENRGEGEASDTKEMKEERDEMETFRVSFQNAAQEV